MADDSLVQKLDEILAAFVEAEESGEPVSRSDLFRRHPDMAEELRSFFADRDRFKRLASPLAPGLARGRDSPAAIRYFGDYELLDELAQGGMGVLYKARQTSLERIVAVKMILAGHLATDADVRRFTEEARTAASLKHKGIVPIHEVGRHNGQHYFSMDLIEGRDLAEVIRTERPSPRKAARIVQAVAEAVHYAHGQGIVHRDIKPSNILLDQAGHVRVTDFGLAMRVDGDSRLTRTGQCLGTPSYMSPEQATANRDRVGPAADVYAMGAVLYELLTGRPPFRGETVLETLQQVIDSEPISPRALEPRTPRDLATICLKCLEKDPHKRYASAESLADDLGRYLALRPIHARPVSTVGRALRWCRRNPALAALQVTVASLLLLLGGGGAFVGLWQAQVATRMEEIATRERAALGKLERVNKKLAETNGELAETNRKLAVRNTQLFQATTNQQWVALNKRDELDEKLAKSNRTAAVKNRQVFQATAYTERTVFTRLHKANKKLAETQRELEHAKTELAARNEQFAQLKHAKEEVQRVANERLYDFLFKEFDVPIDGGDAAKRSKRMDHIELAGMLARKLGKGEEVMRQLRSEAIKLMEWAEVAAILPRNMPERANDESGKATGVVHLSPDGRYRVTLTAPGHIRLCEVATGDVLLEEDSCYDYAFSRDGQRFAMLNGARPTIYQLGDTANRLEFAAPEDAVLLWPITQGSSPKWILGPTTGFLERGASSRDHHHNPSESGGANSETVTFQRPRPYRAATSPDGQVHLLCATVDRNLATFTLPGATDEPVAILLSTGKRQTLIAANGDQLLAWDLDTIYRRLRRRKLAWPRARDWPMAGGTPSRNMVNFTESVSLDFQPARNIEKARRMAWIQTLGSQTYGAPIVADGKVFVGTNNGGGYRPQHPPNEDHGVLLCFDEVTGRFLWQLTRDKLPSGRVNDWPEQGIASMPCVEGDRLWVVTNRAELMCLDTRGFYDHENDGPFTSELDAEQQDADIVWSLDMIGELKVFPHSLAMSSPVVHGDIVFIVTGNGRDEAHRNVPSPRAPAFLAVHKDTGKVVWEDNSPFDQILHGQWSSPAIGAVNGQVQVFMPGGDGWLYAYEPETGELIWKFDLNPKESTWELGGRGTRSSIISIPVFHENSIVLGVGQDPEHGEGVGHLYRIDATKSGDISPQLPDGSPNPSSGQIWHYGGVDEDGSVTGKAGRFIFRRTMSTVAIHKGLVYAPDLTGYLHCLDFETGERYWEHDMLAAVWGSPLVVDDKVLLGDEDGDLVIFQAGKEEKVLAEKLFASSIYSTPTFANGRLFITDRSRLYVFDVQ